MLCSIATKIDPSALQAINELEKSIGKTLLAFQCHDLKASMLNEKDLNKLQQVEKSLGVSLVAVDS